MQDNDITRTPLVSVLMTSHNREDYIGEAIKSVLSSTYSHFELIIVDDASNDRTLEIARYYEEKDRRIRVYINKNNIGDYPNRNKAASYARGEYLKYVDSDDRLYPESLSIMVKMMESFEQAGLGICDFTAEEKESYPKILTAREAYSLHYHKRPIFFASPGQAIFRKEAFDVVGGFLEKRMVGDFEMWHKLTLQKPVILMPSQLYWIRKHPGQEVRQQKQYTLEYEKIKIKYLFKHQTPFTEKEAITIIRKRKIVLLKIFLRKLLSFQFSEATLRLRIFLFYQVHFKKLKEFYRFGTHD